MFKFDSLNRLEQVTDAAGTVLASYVYDARGRLVKRTAGTAVTQFVYRGLEDQVVQEQDGTGAVQRSYAWDTRGRRLLMQLPGLLFYHILNEPHGDVVGLLDWTGAVAGTVHYNAWGQILSQTGTQIPFGFQGGFTDPLTGWVRMGVRWYDPRLGRFTSADPLAPAADLMRPLAGHRWQYAYNNPTHYLDPQGLLVIADGGGGDYSPSPPPPPPSSGCRGDCWWLDPPSTYVPPPPPVVHRPSAARSFLDWVGQRKDQAFSFVRSTVVPSAVKVAQAYLQVRADIDEGVLLWGKDTVTGLGTLAQVAWENKVRIAAFALARSPLRAAIDPVGYQRTLQSDARAVVSFASNPENLKRIGQAIIKPYVEDIQSGHPGRAVGRLLPDIALLAVTGGTAGLVRGGLKGAEVGGTAVRAETMAARLARVGGAGEAGLTPTMETVTSVAEKYGIGLEGVDVKIAGAHPYDSLVQGGTRGPEGFRLYHAAFQDEGTLARTLYHGRTHVWQARTYGMHYLRANRGLVEDETYAADQRFWDAVTGN